MREFTIHHRLIGTIGTIVCGSAREAVSLAVFATQGKLDYRDLTATEVAS